MKVLVTGANGMLGQDLCPILEDEGYEVIETDIHNLDITDEKQVIKVLTEEKPDYVIHCAAYTNVDKAEEDISTARLINSKSTESLAKACNNISATIIYISTDYVFNGLKNEPYLPTDNPTPINNYGLTKYEGEKAVKKYCKKHYIVRTSWLYGHHGRNFVETMILLANKPELKVVNDQIGCPTWTVDLANGIVKLIETADYGTYHVCGNGNTTWYEFAKEIFKQLNIKANLLPCKTEEFHQLAKRPAYSVMNNNKICKNWKISLKNYLELRDN